MSEEKALLKKVDNGPIVYYYFWCPGCKRQHPFHTVNPGGPEWTFNGNMEKPTFTPSLRLDAGADRQCHLNITDGMIQFAADCSHELKSQTVPMEPF